MKTSTVDWFGSDSDGSGKRSVSESHWRRKPYGRTVLSFVDQEALGQSDHVYVSECDRSGLTPQMHPSQCDACKGGRGSREFVFQGQYGFLHCRD